MSFPQIGLSHVENFAPELFDEFAETIRCDGLVVRREARPRETVSAGLEWLLPTAIFIYISKSYFDAFLKEAGKDHYHLLKNAVSKLTNRWTDPAAPKVHVYSSKGKVESPTPRYSLLYSLMGQLDGGISVKLLIQTDFTAEECNRAVNCFLDFLEAFHDGTLDLSSLKGLAEGPPAGRMLLVAFNSESNVLEVVDPISNRSVRNDRPKER